ncbi:AfsR/SARP family transcriptional regulator [Streptomonospora litoralis]|uniref:Regulatory protein AfsR n=1 Tax=Streptomonospora litoralis TaxID=2498135 RepID=A0A4P6Q2N0_9ACTN|nr:BTAD domain-containing putative transcriptional regulator [Streptomonospora litoralis]QBI53034.1 Regulatory protein AfsR [Streptomonospora litoralis]
MDFQVLGPLQVRGDSGNLRLSPKLSALLAALLSRPGVVVAEDRLIDALWGEKPPRSATKSLQGYVHHLRKTLGAQSPIERGAFGYLLSVERGRVDSLRFADLAEQGERALERGEAEDAGRRLGEALRLWRGAAFAGQENLPLVREEAARLNEQRQRVAEERFDTELGLGRHGAVVAELSGLVAQHPFRERLRAQLMIAYYRMGRSTEALEVFRQGRDLLVSELGLEPGRELAALEQAVLRNDPALDTPAGDPGADGGAVGTRWVPEPRGGGVAARHEAEDRGEGAPGRAEAPRPRSADASADTAKDMCIHAGTDVNGAVDADTEAEAVPPVPDRGAPGTGASAERSGPPGAAEAAGGPHAPKNPDSSALRNETGNDRAEPNGTAAPPASVRPVPAQLPPDIADFTGRHDHVADLRARIGAANEPGGAPRPVVVSAVAGMGGVGKTALALRAAHSGAADFPDGQLYANLRGAQEHPADPAQVLAGFLHALGVEGAALPERLEDRSALFRSMLAGRRMLVVLDDAASEAQVRPLVPGAPGCAVLITSRARLTGLESAHLVDLDVFEPGQARELLARIVGEERVAAEPEAAADIARLCGHAPLAVRIAGARLNGRRQWPLSRMVRLLGDERQRLDELATGDLAVRATFALSYAGLAESTRRVFRLLGLLEAGDVAAWTAAALSDTGLEEAEAVVEDLVDAQLLTVSGTDGTGQLRYRMHDLVRLYARERCEAEDAPEQRKAALRRALGGWLWLAEQATEYIPGACYATMHGPAARWPLPSSEATRLLSEPMAWFDAEAGAMAAAVEQACGLGWHEAAWDLAGCLEKYFDVRGRFADWRRTHEAAIEVCQAAGDIRGEAVLRRGLADLVTWVSQQDSDNPMGTMLEQAQRVWELFDRLGDRRGMSDALVMRTWAEVSQGAARRAAESAEAALELAEREDYTGGRARAYQVLAVAAHGLGRPDQAVVHLTRALQLARLLGNRRFEATAMQFLGAAQCEAGELEKGRTNLERSLAMTRALGDRYAEAFSLLYLVRLYLATGDPRALSTAAETADLSRRYGMNHHLADALGLQGRALLESGRSRDAVAVLEESVGIWRTRGWLAFLAQGLRDLAQAYTAIGDEASAERANREADAVSAEAPDATTAE